MTAVTSQKSCSASVTPTRNYALDFVKFMLTLAIVLVHTTPFVGENTRFIADLHLDRIGFWVVHYFFMISGLLMASSAMRSKNPDAGSDTLDFMVRKVKGLALPYVITFVMSYILLIAFAFCEDKFTLNTVLGRIPELFGVQLSGLYTSTINGATWYISAMLICMLPLYFLMKKFPTAFMYVLAPLGMLICLGYLRNGGGGGTHEWKVFCTVGVIRAFAGLTSGVVAYAIYHKAFAKDFTRRQKVVFTLAEILLYCIMFIPLMTGHNDYPTMYSTFTAAPLALAITFSNQSYMSRLFTSPKLKFLAPWSLAIYLCHSPARCIIEFWFPNISYKNGSLFLVGLTFVLCLVYFGVIKLFRLVYPKFVAYLKKA